MLQNTQFVHVFGADSSSAKTGRLLLREAPLTPADKSNELYLDGVSKGEGVITAGLFNGALKLDSSHTVDSSSKPSIFIGKYDTSSIVTRAVNHFRTSPIPSIYSSSSNQNKVFVWVTTLMSDGNIQLHSMSRHIDPVTETAAVVVVGTFTKGLTYRHQDSKISMTIVDPATSSEKTYFFVISFEITTGRLLFHQEGLLGTEKSSLSIVPSALVPCGEGGDSRCNSNLFLSVSFQRSVEFLACNLTAAYTEGDAFNSVIFTIHANNGQLVNSSSECSSLNFFPQTHTDFIELQQSASIDGYTRNAPDSTLAYFTAGKLNRALTTLNVNLEVTATTPQLFVIKHIESETDEFIPDSGFVYPIDNTKNVNIVPLTKSKVLVSGLFNGNLTASEQTITSTLDTYDAFLALLDTDSGKILWAWVLSGPQEDETFTRPAINGNGTMIAISTHFKIGYRLSGILNSNEITTLSSKFNSTGVLILMFNTEGKPLFHQLSPDGTGSTYIADLLFYHENNLVFTGTATNEISFESYHMKSSYDVGYFSGLLFCRQNCNLQNRAPCLTGVFETSTCDVCQYGYEESSSSKECILGYNEELDLFSGSFFKATLGVCITASVLCLIYFIWKSKMAKAAGNVAKAAANKITNNKGKSSSRYKKLNNKEEFEMLSHNVLDEEDDVVFNVSSRK